MTFHLVGTYGRHDQKYNIISSFILVTSRKIYFNFINIIELFKISNIYISSVYYHILPYVDTLRCSQPKPNLSHKLFFSIFVAQTLANYHMTCWAVSKSQRQVLIQVLAVFVYTIGLRENQLNSMDLLVKFLFRFQIAQKYDLFRFVSSLVSYICVLFTKYYRTFLSENSLF